MPRPSLGAFGASALLLLGAAFVTLSSGGCAGMPSAGGGLPQVNLAYETYSLPNGLGVILRKDSRLPVVAVNLWYHVGPAKEAAGRTGFAHLFEHMMFQGSGHVPADGHFGLLQGAGASNVNGSTSFDRTNYLEDLPSNQLELALWLESDRMGFLLDRLDESMLANQQDVVRNELRQTHENVPYGLGEDEVFHQLFPAGHPYHAVIIGSHADVQAAKLGDVRDFFKNFYSPNNATLAIVGDIDIDSTKAMIKKYFGTLPSGPKVAPVEVVTPPITSERRVVMTDQVELPRVYQAWLTPSYYKPGDAEADVTSQILGGGKASRLYKSLVYEKKIAQDVAAYQQSAQLTSAFLIQATAKPGHTVEELEAAIQAELDSLTRSGPTEAEVERARTIITSRILTSIESLGALADRLNDYNHYTGDPGYLNKDLARYAAVTPSAVREFAERHLGRGQRVVVQVLPGAKVLPPAPPTPAPPKKVASTIVSAEPWRNEMPKPKATSATPLPAAQRFQLDNGLWVYLVESHVLPVVTAQLAVRAGSSADPPRLPGLAGFTLAMLDEGAGTRDALGIARDLEALGTGLGTDMGRDGCTLSIRMLKGKTAPALGILADIARAPTFPEREVERVRTERLTSLLQDRDDPTRAAYKTMWRDLYGPDHAYGHMVIGTEAGLKSVGRADIDSLYNAVFRPDNAALVLAGDLTEAEARRLATATFGSWKAAGGAAAVSRAPITPAPERVLIADKPGSPQTTLMVAQVGVPRSDPDYEKLDVMDTVLGGLFSSRINMNLREAHGYTYGAFSSLGENLLPSPYTIGGDVRKDVTGPAIHEIMKEVDRMLSGPPSADELQRAKVSLARSLPAKFLSTASTASTVGQLFLMDLPPDYYHDLAARLDAITAEQVVEVTKKFLRPADMKIIAVGDRAKIEPQIAALKLGPMGYRTLQGEPVSGSYKAKMPIP